MGTPLRLSRSDPRTVYPLLPPVVGLAGSDAAVTSDPPRRPPLDKWTPPVSAPRVRPGTTQSARQVVPIVQEFPTLLASFPEAVVARRLTIEASRRGPGHPRTPRPELASAILW